MGKKNKAKKKPTAVSDELNDCEAKDPTSDVTEVQESSIVTDQAPTYPSIHNVEKGSDHGRNGVISAEAELSLQSRQTPEETIEVAQIISPAEETKEDLHARIDADIDEVLNVDDPVTDEKHGELIAEPLEHNNDTLVGSSQATDEDIRNQLQDLQLQNARLVKEKAQAEAQYRSLFSKVTQMKSTLGERLKQDAEELAQNRLLIEDLEVANARLSEGLLSKEEAACQNEEQFKAQIQDMTDQLSVLEGRNHKMESQVTHLEENLDQSRSKCEELLQSSAEWEHLAIEERGSRDSLRDRIRDLEEQLALQNNAYDNLRVIIHQDEETISKYKTEVQKLSESHAVELAEVQANLQSEEAERRAVMERSEERVRSLRLELENMNHDVDRFRGYEQDVKEKNLLIGKLRHEAIILNEHLTKALRLLKRGSSSDHVDRQLLNNLLVSFFSLPRQDSKRFEILRILGSVLSWTEEQREIAGLVRLGSASALAPMSPSSTRSPPMSPSFSRSGMHRRTSGSVQLQAADFIGPNKESMSELWINFLQNEAAAQSADIQAETEK